MCPGCGEDGAQEGGGCLLEGPAASPPVCQGWFVANKVWFEGKMDNQVLTRLRSCKDPQQKQEENVREAWRARKGKRQKKSTEDKRRQNA